MDICNASSILTEDASVAEHQKLLAKTNMYSRNKWSKQSMFYDMYGKENNIDNCSMMRHIPQS